MFLPRFDGNTQDVSLVQCRMDQLWRTRCVSRVGVFGVVVNVRRLECPNIVKAVYPPNQAQNELCVFEGGIG